MKALIQRVQHASVEVDGETVGAIKAGLLLFIGVEKEDTQDAVERMLDKVLHYRVFSDDEGKMNLSLQDVSGDLLVVSQFTLVATTNKGLRPSFSSCAPPDQGEALYEQFVARANALLKGKVATGRFGADMQVSLVNDGPVTFLLEL